VVFWWVGALIMQCGAGVSSFLGVETGSSLPPPPPPHTFTS